MNQSKSLTAAHAAQIALFIFLFAVTVALALQARDLHQQRTDVEQMKRDVQQQLVEVRQMKQDLAASPAVVQARDMLSLKRKVCRMDNRTKYIEVRTDPINGRNRVMAADGRIPASLYEGC